MELDSTPAVLVVDDDLVEVLRGEHHER